MMCSGTDSTNFSGMENRNGQKNKATAHETSRLDQSSSGRVKTLFEGQATGKESFKADETYSRLVAPESKSVGYSARPSSLKTIPPQTFVSGTNSPCTI